MRFRRKEHLKGRNEIREVFSKGRRFVSKGNAASRGDGGFQGAKLFVLKNNLPYNRICFTCIRGFGSAVERNRAKRLGREAYRNLKPRLRGTPRLQQGYDLILLVYPEETPTLAGRMGQLEYLFTRAGLL